MRHGQLKTGFLFDQAVHLERTELVKRIVAEGTTQVFSEQDVKGIDECIQIATDETINYFDEEQVTDDSMLVPIAGTGAILGILLWAKAHGYRYAEGGVRSNDGDWSLRVWDPDKEKELHAWNTYYFGS